MEPAVTTQRYQPPGPIGAAFIASHHPIPVIMGPGGSGKTVASAYKCVHLASEWAPVCKDGRIRVKLVCLRNVYRDMARTALESWHSDRLFPVKHPFTVEYSGGIDRPVVHKLEFATIRDRSKVPVEFQIMFAAIGEANPEQFVKGFEVTFGWLNELDLFDEAMPGLMFSRTGRYPAVDQIADSELERTVKQYRVLMNSLGLAIDDGEALLPRCLWGDLNPPDPDNWVNTNLLEEPEKWPLYKLFRQPSGLSPKAENRIGKPRSAYLQDLSTMTKGNARRYVYGEIGYSKSGKPVYEDDYAISVHVADAPLKPAAGLPLLLGIDAGGSPAAVLAQEMPSGQMRVLAELCADPGTGATRFAENLYHLLITKFPGLAIREAFADPSSFMGADQVRGELSWIQIVAKALAIVIQPAPSNEPGLRHDAVRWYLRQRIDAETPGLLIDPRCRRLIGGFAAHYKLTKLASSSETDTLIVAKNEYSHVHDALQYVALGHRGQYAVITAAAQIGRPGNVVPLQRAPAVVKSDFDVFAV